MKYKLYIAAKIGIFTLAALLFGCRNKEIATATFNLEQEKVRLAADSVSIVGTYDFPAEAKSMEINIGLEEDLSDAAVHHVHVSGKDFSVTIRDLQSGTTYYYCYTADFGLKTEYETETKSFTTKEQTSYWISVSCEPNIGGTVTGDGSYEAGQICTVTATPAEGYVFSYWKENEIPLTQESTYSFTVTESRVLVARFAEIAQLPVVITGEVTGITGTTAFGSGEVVGEGGSEVTERGVCWALHHTPKTSDNHAGNGAGLGTFTAEMTGLLPDTTYYVRAFAVNSEGTAYGEEKSFVLTPVPPIEYHTIDIAMDMFNEVLGFDEGSDTEWFGEDNITGELIVANLYLNQAMEITLDTVQINSSTALNTRITGRICTTINGTLIQTINDGIVEIQYLEQNQVYSGSTAEYGVVISNPTSPDQKCLYVPNNDKSLILVFDYSSDKVAPLFGNKGRDEDYELYSTMHRMDPPGYVPDECNKVFSREETGLYIYQRGSDGEFFVLSASYVMHNK